MTTSAKTTTQVAQLLKRPGRHRIERNLYLQVKPSGMASWLFRYMCDYRPHWMGLGTIDEFSLKEARERARAARQLRADDVDPLDAKRSKIAAAKLAKAKAVSFAECAERYITAHAPSWKNGKHAEQWRVTFSGSARKPAATTLINDLPVAEIDTALAMKVLEPLWQRTPETGSRVRQRCEQVIAWATAREYRQGSNPFAWRGHLENLLAKRSKVKDVRHHPALPYQELPAFMAELRGNQYVSARALEFTILSAARTAETIGAQWGEIDLNAKVWTIPPERMKAGKEHKVPLSDRALEILSALPREADNPHVFIGGKNGRPLSNMSMLELMRGMRPGYVTHGFRATFRTWCAERTNYPHIVCELALGHTQSEKLMQAYQRGDLFHKRQQLMNEWARYCASPAVSGTVTALRAS